jgi:signal transduction histidine kinase
LSRFILENLDAILQQWENFARSLGPGPTMSVDALRNDAERMLRFVAMDMESAQTREEEIAKSSGHGPAPAIGQPSAAQEHGVARAVDRFSLVELVAEYRALRSSVLRMWMDAAPPTRESVAQILRFSEALDQILAESVSTFTDRLDSEANLFTASVGHDLGNPVNTVMMSARRLMISDNLSGSERAAVERIERASDRLSGLLSDLRDFTRTRLGGLVSVHREACNMADLVRNVVEELEAVHADRRVAVECRGNLMVDVDRKRVSQLLSNLIANALQHGAKTSVVDVSTVGAPDGVTIDVHNDGPVIEPARMKRLFDPCNREAQGDDTHLGLGLYIARQIAVAHGGDISVQSSSDAGTRFTVRLASVR